MPYLKSSWQPYVYKNKNSHSLLKTMAILLIQTILFTLQLKF